AKTRLHRSMINAATQEAEGADLVLWLVESTHLPTDEDETVAKMVRSMQSGRPGWLVLTKTDRAKEGVLEACQALLPEAAQQHLISAKTGDGVPALVEAIRLALPEGPPYFPPDQV